MRDKIIQDLWKHARMTRIPESQWKILAFKRLKEYENQLFTASREGITSDTEKIVWSFPGALFYSATVFTTIGKQQDK